MAPEPSLPSQDDRNQSLLPMEARRDQVDSIPLSRGLAVPADPFIPGDSDRASRHEFLLHEVAKTGDENAMLILLLEHVNPFERDDFDNLAVYYSSLNGHLRCCAWLILAMGGLDKLPSDETMRCATNALTVEIKHLLQGKMDPKSDSYFCPVLACLNRHRSATSTKQRSKPKPARTTRREYPR